MGTVRNVVSKIVENVIQMWVYVLVVWMVILSTVRHAFCVELKIVWNVVLIIIVLYVVILLHSIMPDLLVSTVIPIVRNVLLILSAPNVRVLLKNLMLLVSVSIVRSTFANFVGSLVNVLLVLMDILRVMDCVSFVM